MIGHAWEGYGRADVIDDEVAGRANIESDRSYVADMLAMTVAQGATP